MRRHETWKCRYDNACCCKLKKYIYTTIKIGSNIMSYSIILLCNDWWDNGNLFKIGVVMCKQTLLCCGLNRKKKTYLKYLFLFIRNTYRINLRTEFNTIVDVRLKNNMDTDFTGTTNHCYYFCITYLSYIFYLPDSSKHNSFNLEVYFFKKYL